MHFPPPPSPPQSLLVGVNLHGLLPHKCFDNQLINVTSNYDLSVRIVILFIQDISVSASINCYHLTICLLNYDYELIKI